MILRKGLTSGLPEVEGRIISRRIHQRLDGLNRGGWWFYKPSSVPALSGGGHFSWMMVTHHLHAAYPGVHGSGPLPFPPCLALLRVGVASIPGHPETWWALTPPFHPCLIPYQGAIGGLVSVALSVMSGFPLTSLGITQHPALWSSDFPLRQLAKRPPEPPPTPI